MKKQFSRVSSLFLAVVLMAGLLCVQASAAGSYEEVTFEHVSSTSFSGAPAGKVTIDQAKEIRDENNGWTYYAVPEEVTLTVTPYGTSKVGVFYYNNNNGSYTDVKYALLTSGGELKETGSMLEYQTLQNTEYQLTANQPYTFTVKTSGYDCVDILCGDYNGFGIDKTATMRCEKAAPAEPEQPAAPAFTDVKADAYYAAPVTWAIEKGITNGTSATTFSPNDTCTTAQILTFLWRAVGSPEPTIANPFSDVSETAYYGKAAVWAYEKGLVSGAAFSGNTPCTRAATVTYLWKLAGSPAAAASAFADVAADAGYAQAVAWAVEKGVTSGTSATAFTPGKTCTRAQIVTFLYRDLA